MTERRVRVLHLICGLGGGGSERWLRDIVRLSLDRLEHKVIPVYPQGLMDFVHSDELHAMSAYKPPRSLPPSLRQPLVRLRSDSLRLPPPIRSVARGAASAPALGHAVLVARRFRPHVLHSHTAPDFLVSLAVSMLLRIPLVHTVPCLFSQLRAAGYGWIPTLYARAHPAVALFSTGEGRAELEAVGVPSRKILYDLGGVDVRAADAFLAEREAHYAAVRRRLNLAANCPLLLTVARLDPSKGHILGVEALPAMLQDVPDLHWVVLGEGEQRRHLEDRARELGVADRLHLLGFVPDPRSYQAAAALYLHTALFEPENFSYYEAMAMGLPLVGFDTGERPDLLHTGGHGLQAPRGDVAAFARAAVTLLQMPDRGRSIGARGFAYARRHLDLSGSVARLSQVYSDLARRP